MATIRYMKAEYLGEKNIQKVDLLARIQPKPIMRHVVKLTDTSGYSRDFPFQTFKGARFFLDWVSSAKLTYIFDRRKKDDSLNGKLRRAIIAIQFFEDYPTVESVNRHIPKQLKEVKI